MSLIKIKITLETEIVGENFYQESDLKKLAEDIWRKNRDEIVAQADSITFDVKKVETLKDLPIGWTGRSFPWLPTIPYGNTHQEKRIEKFLKV